MPKPAISGYPVVNRFVRGHIYLIQQRYHEGYYQVGEFRGIKSGSYSFTKIVDNSYGTPSYVFSIRKHAINAFLVREIKQEDYPLFINANHITIFYKRLLSGLPMRKRKFNLKSKPMNFNRKLTAR